MNKSFKHKGVRAYFETGSKAGIQPVHAPRLRVQLAMLDSALSPLSMDMSGWRLHKLTGDLVDHWAVWVDKNWRLTFAFEGEDAVLVDYQDYH